MASQTVLIEVIPTSKRQALNQKAVTLTIHLLNSRGRVVHTVSTNKVSFDDDPSLPIHPRRPRQGALCCFAFDPPTRIADEDSIVFLSLVLLRHPHSKSDDSSEAEAIQSRTVTTQLKAQMDDGSIILLGGFETEKKKGDIGADSVLRRTGSTDILAVLTNAEVFKSRRGGGWGLIPIGRAADYCPEPGLLKALIESEIQRLQENASETAQGLVLFNDLIRDSKRVKPPPSLAEGEKQRPAKNAGDTLVESLKDTVNLLSDNERMDSMAKRVYGKTWLESSSSTTESDELNEDNAERIKREIKSELLEALQNYQRRDSISGDALSQITAKDLHLFRQQLLGLQRDFNLMLQRQSVIEKLLAHLTKVCAANKDTQMTLSKWCHEKSEGATDQDPLTDSFRNLLYAMELTSQFVGGSFRKLQQYLHYPEVFRELAKTSSYPAARKLLEFLSSKRANALIEDLEILAGTWRAAGTGLQTDVIRLEPPQEDSEEARAPWWPERPFS